MNGLIFALMLFVNGQPVPVFDLTKKDCEVTAARIEAIGLKARCDFVGVRI